jgi:FkbM family methyltransferase
MLTVNKIDGLLKKLIDFLIGANNSISSVRFSFNGRKFNIDVPDDELFGAVKDILLLGEYERHPSFRLEGNMDIVIDAGANAGVYILKCAMVSKKVVALEPHPDNFKLLTKNLRTNHLEKKVISLNTALWRDSGKVAISEEKRSGLHRICKNYDQSLQTNAITIKDLLNDLVSKSHIDLFKMDIEGAEYDVIINIDNNTIKRIEKIVIELHPKLYSIKIINEIVEKLRKNNFEVNLILPAYYMSYRTLLKTIFTSTLMNYYRLKFFVAIFYLIGRTINYQPRWKTPNIYLYGLNTSYTQD